MNVAFFGTSDRSIPILESLKNSEYNLVLCITKTDVKVGRKQVLKPTAVKTWAMENGVNFVTTDTLKAGTNEHIKTALLDNNIELGVVADFSFIIPEEIYELPNHKIINIHFSLLPKYRGASPVQFTILNRDEITGISYQVIVREMDAGPIIYQSTHKLNGRETTEELYATLFEKAATELPDVIKSYVSDNYKIIPQEGENISYTHSPSHLRNTHIFKEDAKIDWNKSSLDIYAMIRAFYPWPIAWTTLGDICKLYYVGCEKDPNLTVKIHKAHMENEMVVIDEIQVEGKNKQTFKEFKNGYLN